MANSTSAFTPHPTAKIFVFPLRERMAAQALPAQRFAAMEAAAHRNPVAAASGSWYHDEAIADSAKNDD